MARIDPAIVLRLLSAAVEALPTGIGDVSHLGETPPDIDAAGLGSTPAFASITQNTAFAYQPSRRQQGAAGSDHPDEGRFSAEWLVVVPDVQADRGVLSAAIAAAAVADLIDEKTFEDAATTHRVDTERVTIDVNDDLADENGQVVFGARLRVEGRCRRQSGSTRLAMP